MSDSAILVNKRQRGNQMLKELTRVPWRFADDTDVGPDFIISRTVCAFYLSIRYHQLHPNYIFDRLGQLGSGRSFQLRALLVLVDTKDCDASLERLNQMSLSAEVTLVLAFSETEAARYLENLKIYEQKPSEALLPADQQNDFDSSDILASGVRVLTSIKTVNKTDATNLMCHFHSIAGVAAASLNQLRMCPGLGSTKAEHVYSCFHEPFRRSTDSSALPTSSMKQTTLTAFAGSSAFSHGGVSCNALLNSDSD